jgi:hypothetical protein
MSKSPKLIGPMARGDEMVNALRSQFKRLSRAQRDSSCASLPQRQIVTPCRDPVLGIGSNTWSIGARVRRKTPDLARPFRGSAETWKAVDVNSLVQSFCEGHRVIATRTTERFRQSGSLEILDGRDENSRPWHPSNAVWGHQFGAGEEAADGNVAPTVARERIQLILRYLNSIQQK